MKLSQFVAVTFSGTKSRILISTDSFNLIFSIWLFYSLVRESFGELMEYKRNSLDSQMNKIFGYKFFITNFLQSNSLRLNYLSVLAFGKTMELLQSQQ